jgi:uncharacterized repeat protein (TIGR01451 family)
MKHDGGLGRSLGKIVALLATTVVVFSAGPAGAALRSEGPESAETADLAVELTDSSDPVKVGENFHYNVRVRNLGRADATDVHLKDAIPDTFELVSATGAKSCEGTNDVYCELGEIPAQAAQTVVLHVRATTAGTFSDRAKAEAEQDDPDGGNNAAAESTQVVGGEPDPQPAARLVVVAHVVNDDGGTASAGDFAFAVEGADAKPSAFPGDDAGTTVALGAGAYDVRILPRPGYETTLSPECAGTIPAGEARKCVATADDLAPLALTLSTDNARVGPGWRVGFTATLANRNHEPAAAQSLSVVLPEGFLYRSGSTQGAATADPQLDGRTLTWAGPFAVAAGGSSTLQFVATASATAGEYTATTSASVDSPYAVAGPAAVVIEVVPPQPQPPPPPPDPGPQPTPLPAPAPAPAPAPSPAPAPAGPAPPVFQESADLEPIEGDVLVKLPGTTQFVPLSSAIQAPLGTEVDATGGKLNLVTVDPAGTRFHADFSEGRFKIARQLADGTTELRLSGVGFASCGHATRALASADKKPKHPKKRKRSHKLVRHLWGSGKGKFQTRGRYLAATVHGTTWLTEDRCDSSRAFVQEGVVAVRDLVKRKTVQVTAGHAYVARPRR